MLYYYIRDILTTNKRYAKQQKAVNVANAYRRLSISIERWLLEPICRTHIG